MMEYENGGTDLFTPYEWSYDNIYRTTQFVGDDGTTDYEYDKTSQLTDADHDYQTDESYSYDDNGNRTMTGYQTGDNNQLENDGTYSHAYDDEGNRTSSTNDTTDEVTEYEWDHRNRLIQVTEKDEYGATTQVVEYTYDVFNRRIAKAVDTTSPFTMTDAVIERYVYDDVTGVASLDRGNVVLDFVDPDGEGSTTIDLERRYLYGDAVDQILAQEDVTESTSSADRVYWPLGDHLGTVRDLAKNDGTLGEHYEYDSFGNVVSGDTSATRYLFTSREHDADTGLQYNRARWYDAAVGRWVSEDPVGFVAGDANLARYVGNSPTNAVDSSGLVEEFPEMRLLTDAELTSIGGEPGVAALKAGYDGNGDIHVGRDGNLYLKGKDGTTVAIEERLDQVIKRREEAVQGKWKPAAHGREFRTPRRLRNKRRGIFRPALPRLPQMPRISPVVSTAGSLILPEVAYAIGGMIDEEVDGALSGFMGSGPGEMLDNAVEVFGGTSSQFQDMEEAFLSWVNESGDAFGQYAKDAFVDPDGNSCAGLTYWWHYYIWSTCRYDSEGKPTRPTNPYYKR